MRIRRRAIATAPAKINLSLDIVGRDGRGYHLVESMMHAVDLQELVAIGRRPDGRIRVTCSQAGVPEDESNIAHRAARAFLEAVGAQGEGLAIHIDKAIPAQAGLAGGSADGAAVLAGLNSLWGEPFTGEELEEIALPVGVDLPFCIRGGCVLAQGLGERFTPLPSLTRGAFLLAKPAGGVDTAAAFRRYDELEIPPARPDTPGMVRALEAGSPEETGRHMSNVFEAVCGLPEVASLKAAMLEAGALGAALSGSGSAVAGLFPTVEAAARCLSRLEELAAEAYAVRPLNHGAKVIYLE